MYQQTVMQDGSPSSNQTSTATSQKTSSLPSGIRPSNFIKISRIGDDIVGTFVIDRDMKIPDRANGYHLHLNSGSGAGSIDADVFSAPPSASVTAQEKKVRTMIYLLGGKITINFHRSATVEESYPLYINICGTQNSASTLSLPRSFKGPVQLGFKGNHLTFSPNLLANFTLFIEENGVTEGFIGDFDHTHWKGMGQWLGDRLNWTSLNIVSSTLTLGYDDENF
ncbi:hypothetical protein CPB83DRAFT_862034 [Crepidotus variabilis]|uniref:DUF7330 domain-containing protein n=1 Tax=Crepidotus variabilis TaxID=179855 RepID=A0A9P6E7H9_9AGAR|nr:hypothetical protein CPB83DRAFT_862034 [Crepidotus variabilis]